MNEEVWLYCLINSGYGDMGLVWTVTETGAVVKQILLPRENKAMSAVIEETWPGSKAAKEAPEVAAKIEAYLKGFEIKFILEDLGPVVMAPAFREAVLCETVKIPRGMVDTYGGLAARAGYRGAARAVGNVMANNPFPLAIPCHRVIRSDGHPGCFGGGEDMKRRLLAMEGVTFDAAGRVNKRHFYEG